MVERNKGVLGIEGDVSIERGLKEGCTTEGLRTHFAQAFLPSAQYGQN